MLVLGAAGAVGTAVLRVAAAHAGAGALRALGARWLAVDLAGPPTTGLDATRWLPAASVTLDGLSALLHQHRPTHVINLASLDTIEAARRCDDAGASYIDTGIEGSESRTGPRAEVWLDARASTRWRGAHLVGAGMNPGVVNALLAVLLAEEREAHGADAHAGVALFTEHDETTPSTPLKAGRLGTTWNARDLVAELTEFPSFTVADGVRQDLPHRALDRSYEAHVADTPVEGWLVPHDELITLGRRYPGLRLGYLYRPCASTRAVMTPAAADTPGLGTSLAVGAARLCPPHDPMPGGRSQLGLLRERAGAPRTWRGWSHEAAEVRPLGTSPVPFQVAAGVLAAVQLLGPESPAGMWTVEELDARGFLRVAEGYLGPHRRVEVHPLPLPSPLAAL